MNDGERNALLKRMMDEGWLIEGGFAAFEELCIQCIQRDGGENQIASMKMAFYAGAHHLWSALMLGMDDKPTSQDENRLDMIDDEMARFKDEMARFFKENGIA